MNDIIDNLRAYYDTAIKSKRDWGFFLGIADYYGLFRELPELSPLIDKILKERNKEMDDLDKAEKKAIKELREIKKKLLKIIKKVDEKKEELSNAIKKLNDLEAGKINPEHYKSERLDEGIKNIIRVIAGSEEEFKKCYPRLGFSKSFIIRRNKSWEINKEKETEIWGTFIKIREVFRVIKEYYKHLSYLEKNNSSTERFEKLKGEMDLIQENGDNFGFSMYNKEFSSSNDYRIHELKRDEYEIYFTRLHNYLIKELSKPTVTRSETKEINSPEKQTKKLKRLITRDEMTADFYYRDKIINFNNKQTIYYLIFECLYENSDYNGFCSYESINQYLIKNGEEKYDNERKIKDRIKNGLISLFRFSNLPQKIPTGKDLITIARGKGIIINNPIIK